MTKIVCEYFLNCFFLINYLYLYMIKYIFAKGGIG